MQRQSDRHGPQHDDDMKSEFESTERANRPTRAPEWRDPEPGESERDKDFPLAPGSTNADVNPDVNADVIPDVNHDVNPEREL